MNTAFRLDETTPDSRTSRDAFADARRTIAAHHPRAPAQFTHETALTAARRAPARRSSER